MRKIIVTKDLNYAASKSSTTANTATDPSMLRDGAIGIYGISKTSTNNANKIALIKDGGSDAVGSVPDTAFDGDEIIIAVGTANGVNLSNPIDIKGEVKIDAAEYAAAVSQVVHVGYTGSAGSANLPTLEQGQIAQFRTVNKTRESFGGGIYPERKNYEYKVKTDDEAYDVLAGLAKLSFEDEGAIYNVDIVSNGSEGDIEHTGGDLDLTVVQGSVTATFSQAADISGIAAGDLIRIADSIYRVIDLSGATLTLDRPYVGASATLVADDSSAEQVVKKLTDVTLVGFELTAKVAGLNYNVTVGGILEDADITYSTDGTIGQGNFRELDSIEREERGRKGTNNILVYIPMEELKIDPSVNYDTYSIYHKGRNKAKGDHGKPFNAYEETIVVFPDGGSNGGQAEFEDVLGTLLNGSDGIGGLDA